MGGYCEARAKHGGPCYRRLADPSADRCWMHGGKREPSAAAQLAERDASLALLGEVIDEAMRLLEKRPAFFGACCICGVVVGVHGRDGVYQHKKNCAFVTLRARIEEIRK